MDPSLVMYNVSHIGSGTGPADLATAGPMFLLYGVRRPQRSNIPEFSWEGGGGGGGGGGGSMPLHNTLFCLMKAKVPLVRQVH